MNLPLPACYFPVLSKCRPETFTHISRKQEKDYKHIIACTVTLFFLLGPKDQVSSIIALVTE